MSDEKRTTKRKIMVGEVVSNKMQKTIVVKVTRTTVHPIYKRVVSAAKKFKVHDEKQEANIGDKVRVIQTRPLSKDKCWRLLEVIK